MDDIKKKLRVVPILTMSVRPQRQCTFWKTTTGTDSERLRRDAHVKQRGCSCYRVHKRVNIRHLWLRGVLRKFKTAVRYLLSRDAGENTDPRAAHNICSSPDSSCATPFNSKLSVSLPKVLPIFEYGSKHRVSRVQHGHYIFYEL